MSVPASMEDHLRALQDIQAAPGPQGWEKAPESKFNTEFDCEVLNPNIPNWTRTKPLCQTGIQSLDDVWNSLSGDCKETVVHSKLTVDMDNKGKMVLRFYAQFDSLNPEQIKGEIDGEEIIVTNGEKIQFALPGSIQGRTLRFLQVGDDYRQDVHIPPNMVFFDSVPNNNQQFTNSFQMEAVYV